MEEEAAAKGCSILTFDRFESRKDSSIYLSIPAQGGRRRRRRSMGRERRRSREEEEEEEDRHSLERHGRVMRVKHRVMRQPHNSTHKQYTFDKIFSKSIRQSGWFVKNIFSPLNLTCNRFLANYTVSMLA